MKKNLLNLLLFQVGWLVCVLGGSLYAMAYTAGALAIHQWRVFENREWRLIAGLTLAGCLWDMLLAASGVMRYPGAGALGIPIWLICLWALFATTLPHGLSWLRRYLWAAAVFGAVLGPASYWAGAELTDAALGTPVEKSLGVMAAGWAILLPAGVYLSARFKP